MTPPAPVGHRLRDASDRADNIIEDRRMDVAELRSHLEQYAVVSNEEFVATLQARKKAEMEFHDRLRDRASAEQLDQDTYEKLYGNRKYYRGTQASRDYVQGWLERNAAGKVFLDYCCGNGDSAIRAAKAGAELAVGIDISDISIGNARKAAKAAGVAERTYFIQADAENTRLPDKSIDVALCNGVLHHLDLSYAFPELRRVLSLGGKLLGVEALDYNPAIKIYRKLTPDMRTEWEQAHILSLGDLRFAARFFAVNDVRYWHILSVLQPHLPRLGSLLNATDQMLTRLPLVKLMAWIFTFELERKS